MPEPRRTSASQEKAFAYIEQAKSRSLADLIAFRSQGLPASRKTERALVEQVKTLRGELQLVQPDDPAAGRAAPPT